jgi:hypothetical protein
LHKSPIGYHGLLNLQTVLIDSNWVLKLTNFGIVNMLNKAITRGQLKLIELIPMTSRVFFSILFLIFRCFEP